MKFHPPGHHWCRGQLHCWVSLHLREAGLTPLLHRVRGERECQYLIGLTFKSKCHLFSKIQSVGADEILFCFEGINICKPGFRESLYQG